MPNMSYCRFQNTYQDLMDCYENLNDSDLSHNERRYREKLIELCQDILDEYDPQEEEDEENDDFEE